MGFAYLVALIDVYSRRIMGWRLSNSMSRTFCLEALEDALAQGVADIVNSDQGAQFTAKDWVSALEDCGIRVSMDGKGRCLDNIFIERFWRSIKYEEVYLRVYESLPEARRCIGAYIDFYNSQRPHQSLDYNTPDEVYFEGGHRPVDMMDKPDGLPTSPQAQQQQSGDKNYLNGDLQGDDVFDVMSKLLPLKSGESFSITIVPPKAPVATSAPDERIAA